MKKTILVGLAVLAASTSAGLAAGKHYRHPYGHGYGSAMGSAAMGTGTMGAGMGAGTMGAGSSSDYEQYMRNLRDSGYDPKKDYTPAGTMRVQ